MGLIDASLIVVFFVNFVLAVGIFSGNRDSRGAVHIASSALWASVWVGSMYLFRTASTTILVDIFARVLYVCGILITLFFFYFSIVFQSKRKASTIILITGTILTTTLILLIALTDQVVWGVVVGGLNRVEFGTVYYLYVLLMLTAFIWSYVNLYTSLKDIETESNKRQLRYVIVASLIPIAAGFYFDIVAPLFGDFTFFWLGPVMMVGFVGLMFLAISRHGLFNIRLIATEAFVLVLWVFLLIRTVISRSVADVTINASLFAATFVIGIWLIRSVLKEVQTRERMEELAVDLAHANERLQVLDTQKSEFLSIASHQLRSPLTAIKGYASLLLEGSFGKFPDKAVEPLDRIMLSSERLVIIIEDFLNVSRIEQGRMKYEWSVVDLSKLVSTVVTDQRHIAEKAGLTLDFVVEGTGPFLTIADEGKASQMLTNLIDNSIKYTKTGGITVTISHTKDSAILVKIKDTGIGMAAELIPKLFQKFTRAKGAGGVNIKGTGLGLYVVRELMKAHGGHVWAASEGEGKGSVFNIEFVAGDTLPANKRKKEGATA